MTQNSGKDHRSGKSTRMPVNKEPRSTDNSAANIHQSNSSPRYNLRNKSVLHGKTHTQQRQIGEDSGLKAQTVSKAYGPFRRFDSPPNTTLEVSERFASFASLRLTEVYQPEPCLAIRATSIPFHSGPYVDRGAGAVNVKAWKEYYGYGSEADTVASLEAYSETNMTSSLLLSSAATREATPQTIDANKKRPIDARSNLFYDGLLERNIDFVVTGDKARRWIDKTLKLNTLSVKSTERQEINWQKDLAHSKDTDEANFQRTAMMELLNRHDLSTHLDYICERTWKCSRMPRKRPDGAAELTNPRPDLAVAFQTRELISERDLRSLAPLKGLICPEASNEKKDKRAFHFFAMEAKGVEVENATAVAYRQNFNTASQALHNMYEIMRRAGQEEVFLGKVRVFTAVTTPDFFQVRVHRAEKLERPKDFIKPNYPLEFRFDDVIKVAGEEYTRTKVLSILHSILFAYGVGSLLPILKSALSVVLKRLDEEVEQSRKRPAEEALESFDSSRARMNALDVSETDSQHREIRLAA